MDCDNNDLPIIYQDGPDVESYENARVGRLFNGRRPSRYPIAVVEASKVEHIVKAVDLAKERKCRISVRSGGHSWACWSVRDNAILVDLGNLHHMQLDEHNLVVSVSPSTHGKDLNEFLSKEGLMFAGGHCPDVGLGGFLLQGGMGWNCKVWGWACEQVTAVDVVTAKGEVLRCDEHSNSDLYWAARGAGPGFPAIVTCFHLKVRKSFTCMLSSAFFYPLSEYREAMKWVVEISPNYGNETEIVAVSVHPPDMDQRCIMALFVTFQSTENEAEAALAPANQTRPNGFFMEIVNKRTSLAQEYCDQANANPQGHRYIAENAYVKNEADVPAVLEKAFTDAVNQKSFALYFAMAPCSRRSLPDMALSMQSDHYFALYQIWEDERDDSVNRDWIHQRMAEVVPHAEGAYLGDSDFQERQTKFWTDEKAERLMQIRRQWDPDSVICGYLDTDDKSGVDGLTNAEWSRQSRL